MQEAHAIEDYTRFMEWFERKHPALWEQYAKLIIPPVDGEGVTVEKDGLSMKAYNALVEITREYYMFENRQRF